MSMGLEKYVRPVVKCGPGKTKQSFSNSSNINTIVARYQKTGMMENVRKNPGVFADVSKIMDFQGMVAKIRFAQESFEQLPSGLRKRFSNDPAELIAFVSDDANIDEAIKLGIIPKPKEVVEPVVPAVPAVPVPPAEPVVPASNEP